MLHGLLRVTPLVALCACRGPYVLPVPCDGAEPGPVEQFPAYRMSETASPTGEPWALNHAWEATRVVTVNVDVGSFAATAIDPAALLDSVERAITFWNTSPAAIALALGDTALHCCTGNDTADCRACGPGDEHVDVFLAPAADAWGRPAHTTHTVGDDPTTFAVEPSCLVGSDVTFFPSGRAEDDRGVSYTWVNLDDDVVDLDDSDGTLDKPFHNTLVHELGHVLGLGDQDDDTVACSVMSHCEDVRCGCGWEVIGPVDDAALTHVYGPDGPG